MQEGSRKAIIAAFCSNLGIAVAKLVGFVITGSAGMLAEAGHSFADTGNQALLMLGSKRGKRPADHAHPFGYGPERYFWAFVVALVLFSMGGLFALFEGVDKLQHPHRVDNVVVAFVVLGIAIALETFSLRTAIRESNHIRQSGTSWVTFIRTAKAPELPIVLLEDVGAEVGLGFALVGLTLAEVTGNARWDAVGSVAIGVLLVAVAIVLAYEMKHLLIGEAASDNDLATITATLTGSANVNSIIHLRTMHLGPDDLLVAAKIDFDHSLTVAQLSAAIDDAEAALRAAVPMATTIYVEPDIHRQPSS
jgi:cation diffusion facilitator family transporter